MSTLGNNLFAQYYAQQGLPFGYRRLEYLESDGNQHIDANLSPYNRKLITHIKFRPTTNQRQNNGIFGVYGANDTRYQIFRGSYGASGQGVGSVAIGTYFNYTFNSNVDYDVTLDAYNKTAVVNNNTLTGFDILNGFADYNLYIFWRNNSPTDAKAIMRLYECHIAPNYRNFIPCVRISDSKPGLYDLCGSVCPLTNTPFYVNAGTGEFVIPT